MNFQTLLWEQFDAVLRITTNRPHVLNAQSRVLLMELDEALRRAVDDPDIRVVVIASVGKHFSAGHDLGSPEEMKDQKRNPVKPGFEGEYIRLSQLFLDTCLRWRDVPKPTIAQVQGYCIMGGLMLASCCDLIIASDDALFADRAVPGAVRTCSTSRCPGTSARARPRST
jgi:enoyl-CoA hydratase